MVQELVENPERQRRRNDAEEEDGVHDEPRAQRVQPAKPPLGEDELRHQTLRHIRSRFGICCHVFVLVRHGTLCMDRTANLHRLTLANFPNHLRRFKFDGK